MALALYLIPALPTLLYPFMRDQGVFAAVADAILRGGIPYKDAWDLKPPGIYFLYAVPFATLGKQMLSIRIFELLYHLLTAYLVLRIAQKLWNNAAALMAVSLFSFCFFLTTAPWDLGQADGFLALVFIAPLYFYLFSPPRKTPTALLIGSILGIGMVMKFTCVVYLPVIIFAEFSLSKKLDKRWPRPLLLVTGLLLPSALVLGYLAFKGGLRDFYELVSFVLPRYAGLTQTPPGYTFLDLTALAFLRFFKLRLLLCLGLLLNFLFLRRTKFDFSRNLIMIAAAAILLSIMIQQKYFYYHWLALFPLLAPLSGRGIQKLLSYLTSIQLVSLRVAAITLLGLVLHAAGGWQLRSQRASLNKAASFLTGKLSYSQQLASYRTGDINLGANSRVARYLWEHSTPEDYVFIWGFEPMIYFLAQRPSCSRFITNQPLVWSWAPQKWWEEFLQDFTTKKPQFVVLVKNDALPRVTGYQEDSMRLLNRFPAFATLLKQNYQPVETIEDFLILKLKEL